MVKVGGIETEHFEIISGLRQGCILSPTLFNLALEKAARESNNFPGARLDTGNVGFMAYADDVVMIAETVDGVNEMFTPFQETASRIGLKCNEMKTEMMKMSRGGGNEGVEQVGSLNVRYTEKCKYLGVTVSERNEIDIEIKERIAAGNRCYFALSSIMRSRKISKKTKLRTYNIVIRPTVLYGCDTWTLTKERRRKLEVFENNILRRILGPVFDAENGEWRKRHNEEIREETGQQLLQSVVCGRRARWAGHCARMHEGRLPRMVMDGTVGGRRPVGRPRYRWLDGVVGDVAQVVPDLQDWKGMAEDRILWRGIVEAVMGLQS